MKTFISCCQKSLIMLLAVLLLWCTADAQFNYHRAYNLSADAHTPAHSLTASNEYINVGFYFPNQINGQPVSTARLPVLQLDAGFNVNWSKLYVTSTEVANNLFDVDMRGYDVKEVTGGGYVVCGEIVDTDAAGTTLKSSFIMRIDGGGNVLWFNKYFPEGNLNGILETDAGGFLASGYIQIPGGGEENRLLRVSPSGNVIWLRTFATSQGNGQFSAFRDVARQGPDSYVAVGNCATLVDPACGPIESDVLMVLVTESPFGPTTFTNYQIGRQTDPAGEQFAEFGNAVVVNGQGNIIITGHVVKSNSFNCDPPTNIQDLLLLKVHPLGTVMFAQEVDLINNDIGRDVTINSLFSEICVAGIADGNRNGFLYTTDMNGSFQKLEFFNHAGFDTPALSVVENGAGLYTWIGNSEVLGTGYDDVYLVEQDPTTTQDCNDWDETRDPIDVDLEVFNPDEVALPQDNISLEVEALDLAVIDSVLCAQPCAPPVAFDDAGTTCEGSTTQLVVNVLANDTYTAPVTIPTIYIPDFGVVTLGANPGELQYLPDPGYVGNDTVEYVITDPCGSDTALWVITVIDVPVASFSYSASALTVSFTDLSTNNPTSWDWDFGDGTNSNLQNPTHTYAASGTYTVCLQVDNECGSDTRCEDFTIILCNPVDPVADVMDVCSPNGGSINVLTNDFYSSPITVVILSGPSNGTASLTSPGGVLTYVPNAGFTGTDMLTYRLCNLCGMCGTATVTINVNAAPVANFSGVTSGTTVTFTDLSTNNPTSWLWDFDDGTTSTLQNPIHTFPGPGSYVVCLTATNICGSDQLCEDYTIVICDNVDPVADQFTVCEPTGGIINPLLNDFFTISPPTWNVTGGPSNGVILSIAPNGDIFYRPNAGFTGTDVITYELCDGCGNCFPETITITVISAPVANFSGTTTGPTVAFTDLSNNNPTSWLWDFDDGTTSTLQNPIHTFPGPGSYVVCLTATNICGSDQLCEDYTIVICDNVDPVADQFTVCEPTGGIINPLLNDFFTISPPTWNVTGGPSNGVILSIAPNGDIFYRPNAGFTGTDVITYELCDGCGNCFPETITITVISAPVANFSGTTTGPTVAFTDLSNNNPTSWLWDFDDGTTSTLQNPIHTFPGPGSYVVCLTATNICGSDQLCEDYTIVICDNVDPVADQFTVCEPTGGIINPLLNDFFTISPPTWNVTGGPSNGVILSIAPNGDIFYRPNAGFTGTDVITYELCDGCGNCFPETITITVIAAPVANFSGTTTGPTVAFTDLSTNNPTSWFWDFGDGTTSSLQNPTHTYTTPGNYTVCLTVNNICGSSTLCEEFTIVICDNVDPVTDQFTVCSPNGGVINPLLNDFFTISPPTWNITGGPSNGIITSVIPNGDITYIPNAGFTGIDVITYELCDGCGNCFPEMITITVLAEPVSNFSGSASGLTVAFTDLSTGNPTSWDWQFGDGNSSTMQNPTHTYAAPGTYSVCLIVTNECGSNEICEDYTITSCSPVDPVQDILDFCTPNGGGINILANDFFMGPVTYTFTSGPSNGTITSDDGNGNIYYVPNPGFIGNDTITYMLCNQCGMCGTAQIIISVLPQPDAGFSTTVTGLTAVFSNAPSNYDTYFWHFGDGNTSVTGPSVAHTYSAPGDYTICLIVTNTCGTDIHCSSVIIGDPCETPIAVTDLEFVCPDETVSFNVLINDSFTPPPLVQVVVPPSHGTLTFIDPGTGDMTYQASSSFPGTDSLMYLLIDNCGSDTAWVHFSCEGGILIDPHVILEGFYDVQQQIMSEGLYDNQLLPLQQPFAGAPWNYTGLELVGSYAEFSGLNGNVSDWIMVFLLDPIDPSIIVDQQACLLWSDGQVTGVDGGPVEFDQDEGQYHLALMPHNHLGIVTGTIYSYEKSTPKLVDFSNPAEPTFGGGTDRKAIGGIMALFSGDANGDGAVNAVDKNLIWAAQNGAAPSYLNTADFNGDGAVNAVDKNLFWGPNNGSQGQYPYLWP